MNATRAKRPGEGESTPSQLPQSTPQGVGFGTGDHSFTLQAIMELQKSIGEMNANMNAMRASLDGVKTKVDDLVGWKNKILGGAAALGLVATVIGFGLGKASDYLTWKTPQPATAVPAPSASPPGSLPSAPK